jgi:SprT protein
VNSFLDRILTLISPNEIDDDFAPVIKKWAPFFAALPRPYAPLDIFSLSVQWNPRMRSRAGLCRPAQKMIELNPHLLKDEKSLEDVFLHEVCHMAVSHRWPYAEAHGDKWKRLMLLCGKKPLRCHDFVVTNQHRQKRWDYNCECQIHKVTTLIANRISKGQKYKCKKCGALLQKDFIAELPL